MRERIWTGLVLLALLLLPLMPVLLAQQVTGGKAKDPKAQDPKADKKAGKEVPGKDVFGLTKVWEFHIELTTKDWDKMQPASKGIFGFGAPAKKTADKPAEKPEEKDVHKGSGFGTEFPWVHAELSAEGITYKDIGLRFKGNASYMSTSSGLKRNLRIDLDHFDDNLRFHGLKSIVLNAGGMDRSRTREAFSYSVFRAAGVPAPRTAYAEVSITMPGKYNKEFVGLYTFVEHVDKSFLKDRFKNNKGLLMKPERLRDMTYLGEDWKSYESRYRPKHDPTVKESRRVIDFARLVDKGTDEEFRKHINSFLDVDEYLRFVACNSFLASMDSFFTTGHNYFVYLNPDTNKFAFFPWDLDLSLAGMPMSGSAEQQMDLSMTHPYPGQHKLTDRLMATKEISEQYQKLLKELAGNAFAKERLLADVDAIEGVTKDRLAREKKAIEGRKETGAGGFGAGMFGGSGPTLRTFVEKRTASVTAQLAGEKKGFVPSGGFGFGGGGKGPGDKGPGGKGPGDKGKGPGFGGFGMGSMLTKPILDAADSNNDGKISREEFMEAAKKFFKECDSDGTGTIEEKALADGIDRLFPFPPGFGKGPPGGPKPGPAMAGMMMKKIDSGKNGKVTSAVFLKSAEAFFQESDKDKSGFLDETEITEAINQFTPRFPGFGPPPGPPGGFGPPPGGPPPGGPPPADPQRKP